MSNVKNATDKELERLILSMRAFITKKRTDDDFFDKFKNKFYYKIDDLFKRIASLIDKDLPFHEASYQRGLNRLSNVISTRQAIENLHLLFSFLASQNEKTYFIMLYPNAFLDLIESIPDDKYREYEEINGTEIYKTCPAENESIYRLYPNRVLGDTLVSFK